MKNWITTLAGFIAANALFITPIIDAFSTGVFTGKTAGQIAGYIAVIAGGDLSGFNLSAYNSEIMTRYGL